MIAFPPLPRPHALEQARALGYELIALSAFDHWLSEEEYTALPFTHFGEAVKLGLVSDYREIEDRFLTLYRTWSNDGVSRVLGSGRLEALKPGSRRCEDIFRSSIREQRFMDVYFHRLRVRVAGGYDLTQWLFLSDPGRQAEVEACATLAGLFTLPPSDED